MTAPAFTIASEVTVQPVEWLWFPFVPLGKLTCFAGRMGQGKTLWFAMVDVVTGTNLAIAFVSAVIGYLVFEFLRKKL